MITLQDLYQFMLFEKRRNPEQNPKISAYEYLKKYSTDPNIYVSFTDIKKIGIKPKSGFNTPLGIYTYPLMEIWNNIEKHKDASKVPFAGDRKYIFVLRSKNKKKFIKDMYKDYTSKEYDDDMDKLRKLYGTKYTKKDYENDVKSLMKMVSHYWADEVGEETQKIFDKQKKLTKNNDYHQSYYDAFKQYMKKHGDAYLENVIGNKFMAGKTPIEDIIQKGTKEASGSNPVTSMWNVTRILAMEQKGKALVQWNKILRQLGYTGFADKSGKGIIHSAEPMQAVFLTKDAFKVEDMIFNKKYGENFVHKEDKKAIEKLRKKMSKELSYTEVADLYYKIIKYNDEWLLKGNFKNAIIVYLGSMFWWDLGEWLGGVWIGKAKNESWGSGKWKKGIWQSGEWKTGEIWDDEEGKYIKSNVSPKEYFKNKEKNK